MYPSSDGSLAAVPPRERALSTSASTSSRLSADTARIASVVLASATSLRVNVAKNGRTSSITQAWSLSTMQVAFSSLNSWLNSNPSRVKKSTEASRSRTGRFTKIIRDMGARSFLVRGCRGGRPQVDGKLIGGATVPRTHCRSPHSPGRQTLPTVSSPWGASGSLHPW